MKKIIRTNNLQKALEDYDALKGQAVSYVSVLPLPPNVRNGVYCKQTTTDVEDSLNITVESLIQDYAEETETADHYVIPVTYTVEYLGIAVRAIEVSGDVAIMYEDEEFTTALAATFNLEDKYLFAVTTHVTEMAYYMGDVTNQTLHPVVSFGVIAEVNKRIDVVERELDDKADVSVIVQLDNKIDSNYNTLDTKIDNSYNTLDTKIDSNYNTLDNKIDNEISNLAVNFTTNNLVANVATINNASVNNAVVSSLNVAEIIANGSAGTNGQILGKVNGNLEWQDFSTDNFVVNSITVNKNAVADNASVNNLSVANIIANESVTDNATINNLVVNNATLPRTVTTEVSYVDSDGNPLNEYLTNLFAEQSGFGNPGLSNVTYNLQFLPFITMPESEYNNSAIAGKNATYSRPGKYGHRNVVSEPPLAFIATAPFGNIYFAGKKIADANCDIKVTELAIEKSRSSPSNSIIGASAPTSSLVFTDAPVTNNLLDFRVNATVTSILGSDVFNKSRANFPYGLDINKSSGVTTTNIKNTYFDFYSLFLDCHAMTDCFLTNPSLIVNAPSGYNVWNGVTSMTDTFKACWNFNKPITIPNGVTTMYGTFDSCHNFNQPITIPDSVTEMSYTFEDCDNFNQPITIPKNAERLYGTFKNCTKLASSSVPIHISHEIVLGDTSNNLYNCLVNGACGINWAGRILNDA